MPSFEENLLTQRHQNYLIRIVLETLGCHMVKTRSLYVTQFFRHRVVTDGQTDRQTDGQNRLS